MLTLPQRLLIGIFFLVIVAGGIGAWFYFNNSPGTENGISSTGKSGPIPSEGYECAKPAPKVPQHQFFAGLAKPELVLVLSGQMHGYLQPCGCARPQLGGLERRYELIKQFRARGWLVSPVDLGELAPEQTNEQGRIKFETAMQILQKMDYAAVGMGLTEINLPLDQALGIAQNWQPPYVIATNLNDKDQLFPEMFRPWVVHEPKTKDGATGLKVAYLSVIGDKMAAKVKAKDPTLNIEPAEQAMASAVKKIEEKKPDVWVLLFQGSRDDAKPLAAKFPQFAVVLTQDDTDEPSAKADRVGETLFISLGYKGKYVGALGFFRQETPIEGAYPRMPWQLKYELAALTEHYELPDDATNPARDLMRDYVLRIQSGNFLSEAKWPKATHQMQLDFPEAKYVGAASCSAAACHPRPYAIWSKTKHAHAYEALVKCGRPQAMRGQEKQVIGREYDPECIRCHVTGFDYKTGFVSAEKNKELLGNQCENCHGPASLHVANPTDPKFIKPLQLKAGKAVEMNLCRKCHDADNDPHFDFELYWPKIRHPQR